MRHEVAIRNNVRENTIYTHGNGDGPFLTRSDKEMGRPMVLFVSTEG